MIFLQLFINYTINNLNALNIYSKMSLKIISGPELLPLKIQEGLSELRKKGAFSKEIAEFGSKVFFSKLELPIVEDLFRLYYLNNEKDVAEYYVYVHEDIRSRFEEKFAPFLQGDKLVYDNLINICIMVKDAGDGFADILTANLSYIDRYTILDTGSTDNTVAIIKEVLKNKRGNLYEEPFINFRDSRNRLLDLAGDHCHFNIMLDDTYTLHGNLREFLELARGDDNVDSYSLVIDDTDTLYTSNRITKPSRGLRYKNLIHEIIDTVNNLNVSIPYKRGYIKDINSSYMTDRTNVRKQSDIDILMKILEEEPNDPRTYYYIGTSYIATRDWENCLIWFKKRVEMETSGYNAEFQDAMYYIAVIKDIYLQHPWEECHDWYLRCYNIDPSRADILFFLGQHYMKQGMKNVAFMYWKNAYYLGMPNIQMSVRKHIYNFHIPKHLASLCYELGEYKLGEEAASKALIHTNDPITRNWHSIFYHINKCVISNKKVRICPEKLICFVSPGGWKDWDGETLRVRGLGGSENFSIRYAEQLVKMGYKVVVFCKCNVQKEYERVVYIPLDLFTKFVGTYIIDICIINRFPEFIPIACLNGIKTYYIMHDIASPNGIITIHHNLAGILCISDWHKKQFLSFYPMCASKTHVISYGIDTEQYPVVEKDKYNFIYPSFPNRGLLQLLQMWPSIIYKYPRARLHLFCDTQNSWVQEFWSADMVHVDNMIEQYKDTVTNHGWVNGQTLREYWSRAHVWFYPCTFEETCCLTAWEAAASKTLVVSNHLAALNESVGDRGVIIEGNAKTSEWQTEALERLFEILDNDMEHEYVKKNYDWVKTKNFSDIVGGFVQKFIE